jgi:ubiquinone/menaquinone biosynthesis C-methylase UbiE
MTISDYEEIIRKYYRNLLNREPDSDGLHYFLELIKSNSISENGIKDQIKNSVEYKLSHPIDVDPNTPVNVKMKKEWDARTKIDPLFVIATGHSESEEYFWKSGIFDCDDILGKNALRFKKIIQNKNTSKMNVLEIGCGIGRILIPMSKIFGEIIGVDISSEMVQLGQKHIVNLSNCKILENNGIDLSLFPDNHFDFCYSFIVFQHIPEKQIVENYIKEVSRILKLRCLFRFQVRGTISTKPSKITTWDGVQFTSEEIHLIAKKYNFEIIEEGNDKDEYYWLTFQSKK